MVAVSQTTLRHTQIDDAGTRMRMTAPDLYREERRNAPYRWVHGVGYACLPWWIPRLVRSCTVICAPSAPGYGRGLLTAMAEALFFFSKSRLRSVALTSLG